MAHGFWPAAPSTAICHPLGGEVRGDDWLKSALISYITIYVLNENGGTTVGTVESDWVPISGYEGTYAISREGLVMYVGPNKRYGNEPKSTYLDKAGYLRVTLYNGSSSRSKLLHNLLATAFLDKPKGATVVDHIDGNRVNNNLDNLRWVTQKENQLNRHKVVASSGATGVHHLQHSRVNPWMACGKLDGKNVYLGIYPTKDRAIEARLRWEESVGSTTTKNTGVTNDRVVPPSSGQRR